MRNLRGQEPLTGTERLARAHSWLSEQGPAALREQIELARIPAPPFREGERARAIAAKLESMGARPEFDDVGNLLAWFPVGSGSTGSPPVIIAAHIDTVFDPETPIEINRIGQRWVGPGTTDNARGLAVTLAVLRALMRGGFEPRHPILFAYTVGEEGRGDLRGVKHLFSDGSPLRSATAFIAVDGAGIRRIIHHAIGSRRFRVTARGAGGHSWTDWGRSNPANVIGELIHLLSDLRLPEKPRTTLTVARLGGGTSINAIPAESWVELDLRSGADESLRSTERAVHAALRVSVAAEEARGEGSLAIDVEIIGERPAGKLPVSHPLVQAARESTLSLGEEPEYAISSTDANVPLALGIPAIAIGGGGRSGDTHTENEWFEDTDGAVGLLRLLSLIASVAGL